MNALGGGVIGALALAGGAACASIVGCSAAGGCINACESQDPDSTPNVNAFVQSLAAHYQVACGS